ncbi:hypothetical protein E2C01_077197 [Portunus trituberculatus]|uniref:Uncharacterized protein n=1 Tax=Portunus trituberculatus TaxID=210409 RepID=A0A5B7IJM0_PORTR|nr:hypothetical protein [Portunus trituberculatus]
MSLSTLTHRDATGHFMLKCPCFHTPCVILHSKLDALYPLSFTPPTLLAVGASVLILVETNHTPS